MVRFVLSRFPAFVTDPVSPEEGATRIPPWLVGNDMVPMLKVMLIAATVFGVA